MTRLEFKNFSVHPVLSLSAAHHGSHNGVQDHKLVRHIAPSSSFSLRRLMTNGHSPSQPDHRRYPEYRWRHLKFLEIKYIKLGKIFSMGFWFHDVGSPLHRTSPCRFPVSSSWYASPSSLSLVTFIEEFYCGYINKLGSGKCSGVPTSAVTETIPAVFFRHFHGILPSMENRIIGNYHFLTGNQQAAASSSLVLHTFRSLPYCFPLFLQ